MLLTSTSPSIEMLFGDPVDTRTAVVDNCGALRPNVAVGGTFSNGDAQLQLLSQCDGTLGISWQTANDSQFSLQVCLLGSDASRTDGANQSLYIAATAAGDGPVITRRGITTSAIWPTQIPGTDTQVFVGGRAIPISSISPIQSWRRFRASGCRSTPRRKMYVQRGNRVSPVERSCLPISRRSFLRAAPFSKAVTR